MSKKDDVDLQTEPPNMFPLDSELEPPTTLENLFLGTRRIFTGGKVEAASPSIV